MFLIDVIHSRLYIVNFYFLLCLLKFCELLKLHTSNYLDIYKSSWQLIRIELNIELSRVLLKMPLSNSGPKRTDDDNEEYVTFTGVPNPSSLSRGNSGMVVKRQLLSLTALRRNGIRSAGAGVLDGVYRTYRGAAWNRNTFFLFRKDVSSVHVRGK